MTIGKTMDRMKKSNSLKSQILLLIVTSIGFIVTGFIFTCFMAVRYNRVQYDQWCSQRVQEVQNVFEQKCRSVEDILQSCGYNRSVQRVLGEAQAMAYEIMYPLNSLTTDIMKMMHSYSNLDADIYDLYMVDRQGNQYIYIYYMDTEQLDQFIGENQDTRETVVSPIITFGGETCFAIMQPIISAENFQPADEVSREVIGHSIAVIDARFLKDKIQALGSGGQQAFLMDSEGKILIASEEPDFSERIMERLLQKPSGENMEVVVQDGYVINKSIISDDGWQLALVAGQRNRDWYKENYLITLTVCWLTILAMILFIAFHLLSNINFFVYRLLYHMERIGKGDMRRKISLDQVEEFQKIEEGLNDMMEKVADLSERNIELSTQMYRQQKEHLQTQLLALQRQMNPHFLYNTMECIRNIGICYGVKEIEVLSESLSDIFVYTLKDESVVRLEDELACIQSYMAIQSIRFENRYTITCDVEPQLMGMKIMRLSLEPLVENSVRHGFERRVRNCCIRVSVWEDEEKIHMQVSDNGVGMPEEVIEKVMACEEHSEDSVALKNLHRRLKYFYQDTVDFHISSHPDMGTTVSIIVDKIFYESEMVRLSIKNSDFSISQ